jgi:hypothetical protein
MPSGLTRGWVPVLRLNSLQDDRRTRFLHANRYPLRLKTRLKKTRQNKKIERGRDSIQSECALGGANQDMFLAAE